MEWNALERGALNLNKAPLVLSPSKGKARSYFDELSMNGVIQILSSML